jgi:peptidoglycan/xylan/chitin deacetylase (PgdA/CDA1 family)
MNNRATILMYHILDNPQSELEAKYCCNPENFSEQMAWLAETHSPVSLTTMLDILDGRTNTPKTPVAITFDDGFSSTFEHALPILTKHRIPATMYIVADRVGADNDWMFNRGMPRRALMDATQIREMHASGVEIGSHTLTHPKLSECAPDRISQEISDSKQRLEDLLGSSIQHFAYPFGNYNLLARDMVQQAGYASACSTRSGFNSRDTDRYLLRRIEIFGDDKLWQCKQKMKFGTNDGSLSMPLKYYLQRGLSRLGKKG